MGECIILKSGSSGIDPDDCTATTDKVLKGYTAGCNGYDDPVEGELEVQSILNFNVAPYSATEVLASWTNPVKGPYCGVIIKYKTDSYPENIEDGVLGYKGAGDNVVANSLSSNIITSLDPGTTYYFRVWSYIISNIGEMYSDYHQGNCSTYNRGQQIFTSSTTWTIPEGVTKVDVFCVGAGGGGGDGYDDYSHRDFYGGGGGGGGYTKTVKDVSVTPGQVVTAVIGTSSRYYNGGATSIKIGSITYTANGGYGTTDWCGAQGGSGGGGGGEQWGTSVTKHGGNGGSNGSSGGRGYGPTGSGQGTTTRAFGEPNGTLYAGGGGGGGSTSWQGKIALPGAGGAGGGARGNGGYGGANTGGGGGGAQTRSLPGAGGSGIAIIRWGY